uniref:Uncharacterized protein n=1 Tax=Vespula pensylvanica TaxID=30213 RepID=A0A834KMN0_VESPE|nr:hypothetical protein H0235_013331 [Vespula pensylvanica]
MGLLMIPIIEEDSLSVLSGKGNTDIIREMGFGPSSHGDSTNRGKTDCQELLLAASENGRRIWNGIESRVTSRARSRGRKWERGWGNGKQRARLDGKLVSFVKFLEQKVPRNSVAVAVVVHIRSISRTNPAETRDEKSSELCLFIEILLEYLYETGEYISPVVYLLGPASQWTDYPRRDMVVARGLISILFAPPYCYSNAIVLRSQRDGDKLPEAMIDRHGELAWNYVGTRKTPFAGNTSNRFALIRFLVSGTCARVPKRTVGSLPKHHCRYEDVGSNLEEHQRQWQMTANARACLAFSRK